jgi:hypothetical protein
MAQRARAAGGKGLEDTSWALLPLTAGLVAEAQGQFLSLVCPPVLVLCNIHSNKAHLSSVMTPPLGRKVTGF